ncbi:MAG TPA: hypothetical protein VMU94_09505 [Streptosporangiaceae bacterium]|nr:hypothetical protein [Streptosporangiaceae bacterium]
MPEFYRQYSRRGVDVVFHSFHAARVPPERIAAIGAAIGSEFAGLSAAPTYTYPGSRCLPP